MFNIFPLNVMSADGREKKNNKKTNSRNRNKCINAKIIKCLKDYKQNLPAQVKSGNICENLLKEIRQILYSLYINENNNITKYITK